MDVIAPGVYQVGSRRVGAFLVDGDEGVTLIDTGVPGKGGRILDDLASIGRSADDVTNILVTHAHFDHLGSAAWLRGQSAATVHIGALDAPVATGEADPPVPPFLTWFPFNRQLARLMPRAARTDVEPVSDDDSLPGDILAVATPGHTAGHTCFLLDRAGGIMFVGDAARARRSGRVTYGYINRKWPDTLESIGRIASRDFEVAVFGHGRALKRGAAGRFREAAERYQIP